MHYLGKHCSWDLCLLLICDFNSAHTNYTTSVVFDLGEKSKWIVTELSLEESPKVYQHEDL